MSILVKLLSREVRERLARAVTAFAIEVYVCREFGLLLIGRQIWVVRLILCLRFIGTKKIDRRPKQ
jgi:hypothetical protein